MSIALLLTFTIEVINNLHCISFFLLLLIIFRIFLFNRNDLSNLTRSILYNFVIFCGNGPFSILNCALIGFLLFWQLCPFCMINILLQHGFLRNSLSFTNVLFINLFFINVSSFLLWNKWPFCARFFLLRLRMWIRFILMFYHKQPELFLFYLQLLAKKKFKYIFFLLAITILLIY